MKFLKKIKLQTFLFPLIIFILVTIISYQNYTPNTWLSGWDTLHPEFNLSLAFKRALWGVWRPEQGLGALAGHSHMSELPRLAFLWLSSLLLPLHFLRYFYFFFTLFLGPLGTYYFIKYIFFKHKSANIAAFLGANYYLFNLTTLQHYYVPFEMFATQYAFLPWIFLFLIRYLKKPSKQKALILFLVSFISSPQAYAATLFYAFFISTILFGIIYTLSQKGIKIKTLIISVFVILSANIYWILPNFYSIIFQSKTISQSQINTEFSPEAFLRNKEFGTPSNILIHKNFLFSWQEYNYQTQSFTNLLDEWTPYLNQPVIAISLAITAIFGLTGLILSIIRKDKIGFAFFVVFSVCVFFLLNDNPPFGTIYRFVQNRYSLFSEGFRTPYTKFSIILIFVMSYYFALASNTLLSFINKTLFHRLNHLFTIIIFSILILPFTPMFKGFLISPSMRISIPEEYFEMFHWLDNHESGRIVKLPMPTHWGWTYYDWEYQGAGFTWFGNAFPQLDRDFDRWSAQNETFYNQFSTALYDKNSKSLESLISQYDIKYILLDESVINPGGNPEPLNNETVKEIITSLNSFSEEVVKFGSSLSVYQIKQTPSEISTPPTITPLNVNLTYSKTDPLYQEYGDYYQDNQSTLYPFINFDRRSSLKTNYYGDNLRLTFNLPNITPNNFTVPNYLSKEVLARISLSVNPVTNQSFLVTLKLLTPKLSINNTGVYQETVTHNQVFNIPLSNVSFVGFGDVFYEVGSLNNNLGEAALKANSNTQLTVFSNQNFSHDEIIKSLLSQAPRLCSDPKITYEATNPENITLKITDQAICQGTTLTVTKDALYDFSYDFHSAKLIKSYVCLTKSGTEGCFNDPYSEKPIYLEKGKYWLDFVGHPGESNNSIIYTNLSIQSYPKLTEEKAFNFYDYANLLPFGAYPLNFSTTSSVEVDLPLSGTVSESFGPDRGYQGAYNCDLQKLGKVQKIKNQAGIYYKAEEGGVSCDYFDYPNLFHPQGYILHIKGNNLAGRSLKFYLFNTSTQKVDLENLLPTGSFDEFYYLLPSNNEGRGYTLNIETRAFGRITSENVIEKIEFIPVPLNWLQGISFGSPTPQTSNLKIVNSQKTGTAFYKVTLEGDHGLLVLSQSYDSGWIAFKGNGDLLPHTKVNSWANGWLYESIDDGQSTIVIVYWPQLLEWLGFAMLLVALGFILVHRNVRN